MENLELKKEKKDIKSMEKKIMINEYIKDMPVEIKWSDGLVYRGYLQRKLRTNFEVRIPKDLNKYWSYPTELARIPADVMRKITPEEFNEIGEWSRGLSEANGTKHS